MSLYEKYQQVMNDNDVDAYLHYCMTISLLRFTSQASRFQKMNGLRWSRHDGQ